MKKSATSPPPKGKSKSLTKTASVGLVNFLNKEFPTRVPVSAITAATKYFGKGKRLQKEDKTIQRLAGKNTDIPTATLIDLLSSQETHEKGKPLSDEGVKRVYQNFANAEGKLTFEYILKMAESSGVSISVKMAKMVVRKYGKKDHLNSEDCIKINNRRSGEKSVSRSPQKEKR